MKLKLLLLLTVLPVLASAQQIVFKSMRSDEDYSTFGRLADSSWYHRFKFHPLSIDKLNYISFGGEVRNQYFHYKDQDWGESLPDRDGFVLARTLFHADLHLGKSFRTFVQLQSSMSNGELESPSPVNQNPLDLHQAFIDFTQPIGKVSLLTFRIGRQELSYGSQRLVSLREAPNNRQAFDGGKMTYSTARLRVEGFYTNYVQARAGIFDDRITADTRFWGTYATVKKFPLLKNIDLYYLGIKKRKAVFDDGAAGELRHSVGLRTWNTNRQWQYDIEGVYQFGHFGQNKIAAWTLSSNVAYTFNDFYLSPQLGLKTEAISGDRRYGDGKLNTFNPLFPKGGYFGLAALIGPANLFDIHPYLQISLSKKLTLIEDYDVFWRMQTSDGIYAVNTRLLYSGKNTLSRYIGGQLGTNLEYNPTNSLYLRAEFTWFKSGDYLMEVGPGKDILMSGATITYKF
ncbi:alginate export family protein [Pedobacter duraquae]|uniref:Alginate export protein n=1 Tax=Pedobacter duraquae TaxID=425511 RepID=A0A4V3C3K4_9SPHI|nr:alginate export family protein [Pedobacter duraquae]TDO22388.1 alginate export protein [Pedobacter duraquae]